MAVAVGGGGGWGVAVAGSGSTTGALVGVAGATDVLLGSTVGLGATGGVEVGTVVAINSGLGLDTTPGAGVFVGVGVTVGPADPHPQRSSTVMAVTVSRQNGPRLAIFIRPFHAHGLAEGGWRHGNSQWETSEATNPVSAQEQSRLL